MDLMLSPDFFQCVERHRASLLQKLQENGEQSSRVQEEAQESITSSQVLAAIERIIQGIMESLSRNEAPVLTLDNRSNWANIEFNHTVGLQMAKHCTTRKVRSDCAKSAPKFALMLKVLSVIYRLVQSDTYATKRDIYYNDVQLYGSQTVVDNIISDLSCMLKIPRINLHILSTSKGCVAGDLWFTAEDGNKVYCGGSSSGVLVPINVEGIRTKFILIIEKDATFQRLLDDNFCSRSGPCILITGKGVPDLNTRLLTRKLWDSFHIPIFTLVDADPYGIEIMCIYKYGSIVSVKAGCCGIVHMILVATWPKTVGGGTAVCTIYFECAKESMSYEAHHLTVPAISWLGLLPSDLERLFVPKDALIPLSAMDQRKLLSIQKRPYISCQPIWKREIEKMAASGRKAEIQALTSISPDFLSRVYLPNKLRYGGWI